MWTRAKNGSLIAAKRFAETTRLWAQVFGWVFSFATLVLSIFLIEPNIFTILALAFEADPCTDTNIGSYGQILRDSAGDTCTWYDSRDYGCGQYDNSSFRASSMCCACGGGIIDTSSDSTSDST